MAAFYDFDVLLASGENESTSEIRHVYNMYERPRMMLKKIVMFHNSEANVYALVVRFVVKYVVVAAAAFDMQKKSSNV